MAKVFAFTVFQLKVVVFHIHAAVPCNFSPALGSMNGCMLGSSWEMRNKMAHKPTHPRKWKNPSVWHWNQLARGSIYKIWKASGAGWLVVAPHCVTSLLVGNGLRYLWIYVYIRAPNGQYMSSWCIQKGTPLNHSCISFGVFRHSWGKKTQWHISRVRQDTGQPSWTRRGGAKEIHHKKKAVKTLMHLTLYNPYTYMQYIFYIYGHICNISSFHII